MINKNVAIVGASSDSQRYSYMAMNLLEQYGYHCLLINPNEKKISGKKVFPSILSIEEQIDTITIYLSPEKQTKLFEEILSKGCRRVIFNPGTENSVLENKLKENDVIVTRACTLVMLETNTFE